MRLRIILAGAMLTLGGCEAGNDNQATEDRGPAAANAIVGAGAAPVDCSELPGFVPLYGDARVETCVSGPGVDPKHESGTVIYTTGATPAAVLAWYKEKAAAEGLAPALSSETMFSAREGSKRSLMAMTQTVKGATKVTLNWGRDL